MYLLKRLIFYTSLMVAILLFSFLLFHAIPSDPARIILGPNAEERQIISLKKELGLDKPLHSQFITYLKNIAQFDFGRSYIDNRPVIDEVADRFVISLTLVFFCVCLIIIYSLFTIQSFYHKRITGFLNFFFISTPTFFSGLVVALIAVRYLPFYSFSASFINIRDYVFFFPPAFVLALYPMGVLSRILKKELERIIEDQYILAARAFALPERVVFYKYALKNALVPYFAALSNQLPMLFTGAFIIEIIFSIPGVGTLLMKSVFERDLPMLEGIVIVNGLVFILTYFLFEALYPIIDPRIRKR